MFTVCDLPRRLWLLVFVTSVGLAPPLAAQPQPGEVSRPEFEIQSELNARVAMRDNVHLAVDIFRPQSDERFAAVLLLTPYGRTGNASRAKWFAERGYVVVNADTRGRFDSEGQWDPFSPQHKTDGYDLVQWIARQPWCSGNVGMFGLSYMGWTQWWTATQAPPALKAIVPEVAPPDHFYNCPYQNGVLVSWMLDWGGVMSGRLPHSVRPGPYGGFAVDRESAYRHLPYIELDEVRRHLPTTWWSKWLEQNTSQGEYWRAIAYQTAEDYARVQAPSLAISGWFDANFPGTPANYLAMKQYGSTPDTRRPRMIIGPWEHAINRSQKAADVDFGPQAIIEWDAYVCRWFDHYLKGIDNGVQHDPPVHVFVMGRNEWRASEHWPLPGARSTQYFLHSAGRANSSGGDGLLSTQPPGTEPADEFTYDPADPTPSPGYTNGHIDGPRDVSSAADRDDVLVYQTPVLEQEVEVIGPISATLYASTSAQDTDWMVRLVDVFPDGRALLLAEGVMRARHRDEERGGAYNPARLSTLEPDRVYAYQIDFWRPTGNAFLPGHRIRVEISSSYYPYYLRNLNSGDDNLARATTSVVARQRILHDAEHPSHVTLPILPAK